jgi:Uncharacterised nucleotidyltransferase
MDTSYAAFPNATSTKRRAPTNPEWALLLELARANPDPPRIATLATGPLDWSALLALAQRHGLLPLLTRRLKTVSADFLPSEICRQLQERNRAHELFALSLSGELFRLLQRFASAHIETVIIKGPVLSMRCYGDHGVRQYTDLDLVVRTSDIHRTTQLMLGLGYLPRIPLQAIGKGKIPGEYVFRRPDTNLLIEFHTEHTFRYYPRRLPLEEVLARKTCVSIDGRQAPALALEDELVLICIHAAKHLWERLAWVADVAALVVNNPGLNWQRAQSAASKVGAQRMLRVAALLAARLLAQPFSAEIVDNLESDATAARLAAQIATRLEQRGPKAHGILSRAAFRVRMRGGLLPGLYYLLRLTLSPTEDDWSPVPDSNRPWVLDAISRPFHLARKYDPRAAHKD